MKKMKIKALFNDFKQKYNIFHKKMSHFFKQIYNDLLILSGLFFIIYATFLINKVAGFYCTGAVLLGLGIWFTYVPPERR